MPTSNTIYKLGEKIWVLPNWQKAKQFNKEGFLVNQSQESSNLNLVDEIV